MDITKMSIILGRTAFSPQEVEENIVLAIEKENQKRMLEENNRPVTICEVRDTSIMQEEKEVKELIRKTSYKGKLYNCEQLGYFIISNPKNDIIKIS